MKISVKLFGPQAATAGGREVVLDIASPSVTCADLRAALAAAVPSLAPFVGASRLAVNHAFASESALVRAGDEVALIGLVSGG